MPTTADADSVNFASMSGLGRHLAAEKAQLAQAGGETAMPASAQAPGAVTAEAEGQSGSAAELRALWSAACPRLAFESFQATLFEEGYTEMDDLRSMDGGVDGDEFRNLATCLQLKAPEVCVHVCMHACMPFCMQHMCIQIRKLKAVLKAA